MSKIKTEFNKVKKQLKDEFNQQKEFFKKPDVLISLSIIALSKLDSYLKEQQSEKEINDNVRNNTAAKIILAQVSQDISEENLNELLINCLNENIDKLDFDITDDLNIDELLNDVENKNDIDNKVATNKIKDLALKLLNNSDVILAFGFLLYYVIDNTKKILKDTRYPSPFRMKFLQKLVRYVYGIIKYQLEVFESQGKQEYAALKNAFNTVLKDITQETLSEIKKLMSIFKKIDNILIAIGIATTIYILNRRELQKRSSSQLNEISNDVTCNSININPRFNIPITVKPFKILLDCPVNTDDLLVPITPIEDKIKQLSCEISQNDEADIDGQLLPELATIAIIRNERKIEPLVINVIPGSFIKENKQIGVIGKTQLFSPISGYVDKISSTEIVIKDIVDTSENFLATQIELLSKKYERLNAIKPFIRLYYIESIYPYMLALSSQAKLTPGLNIGIEKYWKEIKNTNKFINDRYENNIKNITGNANVEKHAKNETLDEILKETNQEHDILFKRLFLLGDKATNNSKQIIALPKEYNLFEYYTLSLGALLNKLENPTSIEIEFRDMINSFIRKRFIIDDYHKNDLANKINIQIKDIEKGLSLGNWFQKALTIYKQKKSLTDLRAWLQGLANENGKMNDTAKKEAVNKIMFNFELYLEYDQINQKYKTLKNQTSSKKETIIEGNLIVNYFNSLKKEYAQLQIEIVNIQTSIDNVSLFQTYSLIQYENKQARLYVISDDNKCEVSDENESFKRSKYGYGDIQYWLKYCSFATLASVTNPTTGWSTGWVVPSPILFPVVYIPVKVINTKYGFIVMGISICGIWVYPWVLFANLSYNSVIPIGDPLNALKQEIEVLKKTISEQLSTLRTITVKHMMDDVKVEIGQKEKDINKIKQDIEIHKTEKPKKYDKNDPNRPNFAKRNLKYADQYTQWLIRETKLAENLATYKYEKWLLTRKWKILNNSYKLGKSLKGTGENLEKAEEYINKKFDKLNNLIDKLNKFIEALPISLKPNSANFGLTLKALKPINVIDKDFNENINDKALKQIRDKFKLKNSDMMSPKYKAKISKILNSKEYKEALSAAIYVLLVRDPFPKYENLKLTNIPWMTYLYLDFIKVGAQIYGFPGLPPYPVG